MRRIEPDRSPIWWTPCRFVSALLSLGCRLATFLLQAAYDFFCQPVQTGRTYTPPKETGEDPLRLADESSRRGRIEREKALWEIGVGLHNVSGLTGAEIDLVLGRTDASVPHHTTKFLPMMQLGDYQEKSYQMGRILLSVKLPRRQLFTLFPPDASDQLKTCLEDELDLRFIIYQKPPVAEFGLVFHHLIFRRFQEGTHSRQLQTGLFYPYHVQEGQERSVAFNTMRSETVQVHTAERGGFALSPHNMRLVMMEDVSTAAFCVAARQHSSLGVGRERGIGVVAVVINQDQQAYGGSESMTFHDLDPDRFTIVEALAQKNLNSFLEVIKRIQDETLRTFIQNVFKFNQGY